MSHPDADSSPCRACAAGHLRALSLGLALLLCGLTSEAGAQSGPDDVVPAAIDAALAAPDDPFIYGIPDTGPGIVVTYSKVEGSSRSVVGIGDVNGDGAWDFATGFAPGSTTRTLQARDGRTAAVLWSAAPDGGGFRGLRTLVFADGALFLAASSAHGRVERRDPFTGVPQWTVDLTPGGGPMVNLLALESMPDVNTDGATDLLVAAGRGLNALRLLSGLDGTTLWTHVAGDSVCDVRVAPDVDADGVPEVLCCGGEVTPYARLLSGATGAALWSAPLPGTGSAILPLPDIDADGWPDVAVGVFNQPGPCLFALGGRTGALLWTSQYAIRDVTSLTPLHDLDADGLTDFAVGGFDNAATGVVSRTGIFRWRTEGSTVNGGSMFFMANIGDIDGNGAQDLVTCSLDEQVYLVDGRKGYFLSVQDMDSRGVVTAGLNDADGDGRPEFVACGGSSVIVLDGGSGIAAGPVCYLVPPKKISGELGIYNYAYPGLPLVVLGAPAQGNLKLPGYTGSFGLSLTTFQVIFMNIAPGAGLSGYLIGPLPREAIGLTLHFQSVSISGPGHGGFSKVASYTVTP